MLPPRFTLARSLSGATPPHRCRQVAHWLLHPEQKHEASGGALLKQLTKAACTSTGFDTGGRHGGPTESLRIGLNLEGVRALLGLSHPPPVAACARQVREVLRAWTLMRVLQSELDGQGLLRPFRDLEVRSGCLCDVRCCKVEASSGTV